MKTATDLRFSMFRRVARAALIVTIIALAILAFYPKPQSESTFEGSDRALPPGLHALHHYDALA